MTDKKHRLSPSAKTYIGVLDRSATYTGLRVSMRPFLKEFVKLRRFPPSLLRSGGARSGCQVFLISWPC
jgi:hypothetical protein